MSGLLPLLKKEIKEQIRTYKLLVVGGIFLFFGIVSPLTLKFLPQIIKMVGEQIPIEIPPPTAIESLAEYTGTIGQIGVLVMVLVAMGAIANEIKHGTALLTLSKPVTRAAFVAAKFIAACSTMLISLFTASLVSYGYTIGLIGPASVMDYTGQILLLALFLMLCLAITILFSSLFKSSLAAGGISIGTIIFLALISTLPVIGDYLPGKLLTWGNNLLINSNTGYWWALTVTLIIIGACLFLAQLMLKKKEI